MPRKSPNTKGFTVIGDYNCEKDYGLLVTDWGTDGARDFLYPKYPNLGLSMTSSSAEMVIPIVRKIVKEILERYTDRRLNKKARQERDHLLAALDHLEKASGCTKF